MENQRPFLPAFLKKIDNWLLLHRPVTWSSRIHISLWYGAGILLVLLAIGFAIPADPRNNAENSSLVTLIGVAAFLAFITWCIFLFRFNVFKRFGNWGNADTLKTFLFYFITIALFVSWALVPSVVQSAKANMKYGADELATDINTINYNTCLLERDSADTYFERDTLLLDNTAVQEETVDVYAGDTLVSRKQNYYRLNEILLKERLSQADSTQKLNDSLFVAFNCPNYCFVSDYNLWTHSSVQQLSSMDLYKQVISSKNAFDHKKTQAELERIIKKYTTAARQDYYYPAYHEERSFHDAVIARYRLYIADNSIRNITEKKYRWDRDHTSTMLRVVYYISLALALGLLVYRHTTRKTFFLTLLTAIVLTIITGLIIAASYHEISFFGWVIFYCVAFLLLCLLVFRSETRDLFGGISINAAAVLTPFFPLACTALHYSILRSNYYYHSYNTNRSYSELFRNEAWHYFLAEAAGFIILLVLLGTLFRAAWKKWYALPEQ